MIPAAQFSMSATMISWIWVLTSTPSIAWVQGAVQGKYKLKYPFHISEYAHSMGNACGNLIDYWDAIESTNFFMGGADPWHWVDQALNKTGSVTGKTYWAYGGDFGKGYK